MFMYYLGHIPVSSLHSVTMPELRDQMKEICGEPHQLLPVTTLEWPFPAFSPDRRYYVDIDDARFRRAEVLKLYGAATNQLVGTYSYFRLKVYCWAPDSSGIYVADYVPGSGTDFLFSTPGRTGPVKKLLVP